MATLTELAEHVWWSYGRQPPSALDVIYRTFNLCEGAVWMVLGVLVAARWRRFRHSAWEFMYAAAFGLFGVTDWIEASYLPTWLILVKGLVLAALLVLRWHVLRRFYPTRRLY